MNYICRKNKEPNLIGCPVSPRGCPAGADSCMTCPARPSGMITCLSRPECCPLKLTNRIDELVKRIETGSPDKDSDLFKDSDVIFFLMASITAGLAILMGFFMGLVSGRP